MKKFTIALIALIVIALPVFAAAINGAIDLDGLKAAEKAALLKSWEEAEKAAPTYDVVIGEVTVKTPEVAPLKKVETVKKPIKTASVNKKMVCRSESLKDGNDSVTFCSTVDFRIAVDASEGSI